MMKKPTMTAAEKLEMLSGDAILRLFMAQVAMRKDFNRDKLARACEQMNRKFYELEQAQ